MNLSRTGVLPFTLLVTASCGVETTRSAVVAVPPPALIVSAPTAPTDPLDARWLRTGGPTRLGPVTDEGTMVLLGGRRALVRPDGSVRAETSASPEPLFELARVPSHSRWYLVGVGRHGLYRFDDPLGAASVLTTWKNEYELHTPRVAGGPGFALVWSGEIDAKGPKFLDVQTGAIVSPGHWPGGGIASSAFVNDRVGVVSFEAMVTEVTTDGGETFHALKNPAGDVVPWVDTVEATPGGLFLRMGCMAGPCSASVDPDTRMIGALKLDDAPVDPPSRFTRAPSRDTWLPRLDIAKKCRAA